MFSFELTISQKNALAPGLAASSQWAEWLNASSAQEKEAVRQQNASDAINLDFLPAMQRRRLSPLSRLVFAAAWPILQDNPSCPVVFSSRNGEINRSFQLLIALAKKEGVSPTSFGLSVHNAIGGQLAIQHSNEAEQSAISARDNGIENALLDAWLLLQDGAERVLVICAQDPLDTQYDVKIDREPFPFACALLITRGSQWRLSRGPLNTSAPADAQGANQSAINSEGDAGVIARLEAGHNHWTTPSGLTSGRISGLTVDQVSAQTSGPASAPASGSATVADTTQPEFAPSCPDLSAWTWTRQT